MRTHFLAIQNPCFEDTNLLGICDSFAEADRVILRKEKEQPYLKRVEKPRVSPDVAEIVNLDFGDMKIINGWLWTGPGYLCDFVILQVEQP